MAVSMIGLSDSDKVQLHVESLARLLEAKVAALNSKIEAIAALASVAPGAAVTANAADLRTETLNTGDVKGRLGRASARFA